MTATLPSPAPTVCRLSDGTAIVAEQMPVDAVSLNVWFDVGSAIESDDINGMAHFLEHMTFKGSESLKPGEFDRLIEARGAVANAATGQDYTHYFLTAAPQHFAELAPLQLEVVCRPSIPEAEFGRERSVVLEEIRRAEDNPNRRTYARVMETCFERLPYRRPILGPADVVARLTPQQMRDFHEQWYRPPATTIAVAGNLPAEEMIQIVAAGLERLPQRDRLSPQHKRDFPSEAPFEEIVRRDYSDRHLQQARLGMAWRVPGWGEPADTYALDVLAAIIGQGKTSRLYRELREGRNLVSAIGASNATQRWQGYFSISARLNPENLAQVEAAIGDGLRRLQEELVTPAELERVRTTVANRFIFGSEKPSDRTNLYGYYLSQLGELTPALEYPDRIRAVDAEQVRSAAERYLSPEAYGIVVARPC